MTYNFRNIRVLKFIFIDISGWMALTCNFIIWNSLQLMLANYTFELKFMYHLEHVWESIAKLYLKRK